MDKPDTLSATSGYGRAWQGAWQATRQHERPWADDASSTVAPPSANDSRSRDGSSVRRDGPGEDRDPDKDSDGAGARGKGKGKGKSTNEDADGGKGARR